jgi:hypothetical protein
MYTDYFTHQDIADSESRFIAFSSGKVITMPNWWGNNAESVERCFALDD